MATTPSVNTTPGASATPQTRGVNRKTDVTLSVVFLGLQLVFVLVTLPISLLTGVLVISHSPNYGNLAFFLTVAVPGILFLISLGVDLFLLISKRITWIVALVGLIASVGVWILGASLWNLG